VHGKVQHKSVVGMSTSHMPNQRKGVRCQRAGLANAIKGNHLSGGSWGSGWRAQVAPGEGVYRAVSEVTSYSF
jgi:hypothetical protein